MSESRTWTAAAVALAAAVSLLAAARSSDGVAQLNPEDERTQFVLVGFDINPSSTEHLEGTDYMAYYYAVNRGRRRTGVAGGYTMFLLSGGLQLDPATPNPSPDIAPLVGRPPRRMGLQYADDVESLRQKIANIRRLAELGVEMASHGVRHRHGAQLDEQAWRRELEDVLRIAELHDIPRPVGFRAPFLETNEPFFSALGDNGFTYDVSQVGGLSWPERHPRTGVWQFTVPSVRIPGRSGAVLFYDENTQNVLRAEARDRGLSGADARRWVDDTFYEAGLSAFRQRYRGARAPFVVGGHNRMRAATVRLLREVCGRPHVRCATFSEAVRYLQAHPELEGVGPRPRPSRR